MRDGIPRSSLYDNLPAPRTGRPEDGSTREMMTWATAKANLMVPATLRRKGPLEFEPPKQPMAPIPVQEPLLPQAKPLLSKRHTIKAMIQDEEEYDPSQPNNYDKIMKDKKEREAVESAEVRESIIKESAAMAARLATPSKGREESKNTAMKLMEKMGWKAGEGLGSRGQGITAALVADRIENSNMAVIKPADTPLPAKMMKLAGTATRVVMLTNVVGPGQTDGDLESETAEEASKFGNLLSIKIHEIKDAKPEEAVRIFLEYEAKEQGRDALNALKDRNFAGRIVKAEFYNTDAFLEGKFELPV